MIKVLCVTVFQATLVTIATPAYYTLFQALSFLLQSSQTRYNETIKFCATHVLLAADKVSRKFIRRFSSKSKIISGYDRQNYYKANNLHKANYFQNDLHIILKQLAVNQSNKK